MVPILTRKGLQHWQHFYVQMRVELPRILPICSTLTQCGHAGPFARMRFCHTGVCDFFVVELAAGQDGDGEHFAWKLCLRCRFGYVKYNNVA